MASPTLPDGHFWGEYLRVDDPFWRGIRSSLVGFVAIDDHALPQFLGTGFVIAVMEQGFLLVLTAKHVVADCAVRVQRRYSHRSPSAPSILFEPDKPLIGPENLRALWICADRSDMMFVRHVSYADNLDVALCLLEAQPALSEHIRQTAAAIALDTELPKPGSWINIVSLSGFEFSARSSITNDGRGVWSVSNRPVIRIGKVVSLEEAGMGHRGPCFRTTVPVSAGMSGGFAYVPRHGLSIAACGIVSAGSQSDGDAMDFRVSGDSLMAGAIGTLALPMPPTDDLKDPSLLFHALRAGLITDMSGSTSTLSLRRLGEGGACEIFHAERPE